MTTQLLLKLYRLTAGESTVVVYATSIEEAVRLALDETYLEAFGQVEQVPFERGIVLAAHP